ncbi:uncharacterized protein LOC100835405 isoform X4 [Brachypodium distachyon]|uniref:uncharacterized protein LOC100835405 isoform X4 n=1 Tax=Brachypodium distachyon TaxID=15368 RepID=UPI00052FFF0A|nr:uncharacterized protein LOC100835405 isoform X4 [Brachypodium distachyon]XP_024315086.1 uncharacterized protein LOC100835405 isoform X4 [Brachypodium distachyon]|eukprot:XP_010231573.1 uncharacterized protein LOC100835405 isoform X4 [Brachypodium distachyon]
MALALLSPAVPHPRRSLNSPPLARTTTSNTGFSFFTPSSSPASRWYSFQRTSSTGRGDGTVLSEAPRDGWLDADLLRRISGAGDADQALDIIAGSVGGADSGRSRASLDASDCHAILAAALDRGNVDLALSVFEGMRYGFSQGECWSWARPDARTYALLVQRLAAALRVSDAIRIIDYVSGAGASSAEEFFLLLQVPFGITVRCPTCTVAIAVAQPQHGTQVVSCSKCRYQYELFSGQITSIESEEVSMDISALEKALRFINVMKDDLPAAVHSILIQTPSGIARTHRFATKTVELPAQEGERVTISSAAPTNTYREMGPLKIAARSKGFGPGEPMCLTNHISGQVSKLLRAPSKNAGPFVLTPYLFVGALALLASGDAVSAFIDPSLPRLITATAIASAAVGTTLNQVILPETRKLPQKAIDIVAVRQQLLSQYDMLQSRLKDLKQLAEKEVWMLARMCRLENKILSVGEPSYRARRGRVKRVRKSLETTLSTKIELMESYAKLCSMIEIEVEMDSDVIVAEAASGAERISEQIQQLMEIDGLEEQWRIQAEANDEAERLLSSDSSEALSAENV